MRNPRIADRPSLVSRMILTYFFSDGNGHGMKPAFRD
jgi:hypothetical protein